MARTWRSSFSAQTRVFLSLLVAVSAASCGGGGGGGHHSGAPSFRCSGSPVAANAVALVCGTLTQSDVREVLVVIGGSTTSDDIEGFDFDIVFDPADLSYVHGSATLGTLLSQDGDDPLLAAGLANNDPGRLIVGVHRTNQPHGVRGTAAENLILTFSMRANMLSDFGPIQLQFQNAEAVDSFGTPIGGISFSDQLLLSVK